MQSGESSSKTKSARFPLLSEFVVYENQEICVRKTHTMRVASGNVVALFDNNFLFEWFCVIDLYKYYIAPDEILDSFQLSLFL